MKLYSALKSLILEVASIDSVIDAVKNRKRVIIYYDGDEPGGRGLREIEPVCFGYSKANNPVLRAWDLEGSSHTAYKGEQPLPGWRLFRVDKISSFKPTGEIFNEIRPDYNTRGDKTMSRVIINAKYDKTTETNMSEIVKNATNSLIERLRTSGGLEAFRGVDFTKAADLYRQVYLGIEKNINRKLTPKEKDNLKPQISLALAEAQKNIK